MFNTPWASQLQLQYTSDVQRIEKRYLSNVLLVEATAYQSVFLDSFLPIIWTCMHAMVVVTVNIARHMNASN